MGDTVLDVCHLECGLLEVKNEPGADDVRPRQVLPTIIFLQRNRLSCQFLDLSDFIQSIGHHELGDIAGCTNRNQNCRHLLRSGQWVALPVNFLGGPYGTLGGSSCSLLLLTLVIASFRVMTIVVMVIVVIVAILGE